MTIIPVLSLKSCVMTPKIIVFSYNFTLKNTKKKLEHADVKLNVLKLKSKAIYDLLFYLNRNVLQSARDTLQQTSFDAFSHGGLAIVDACISVISTLLPNKIIKGMST